MSAAARMIRSQFGQAETNLALGWRDEAGRSYCNRHLRPLDADIDAFDRASGQCLEELEQILSSLP